MRLLHAKTFQFEEFFESQLPPYAILSHTWRDGEVQFKDMEQSRERAGKMAGWFKIENCCELARFQGLEWVWIDTCCIDKSSSAELSEAINSMFNWYRKSAVCYAYLDDVPAGGTLRGTDTPFARSRWFTRGWTLQELLAPESLTFYVQDTIKQSWQEIGTRKTLIESIASNTRIPVEYLWGLSLDRASVAQRMSWASRRETTREEDVAYCLMGIFNINMPLLYGEGGKAFIRLQEQIVRESADQSILAWGLDKSKSLRQLRYGYLKMTSFKLPSQHRGSVFATHPSQFEFSGDIRSYRNSSDETFELTNRDMQIAIKLIDAYYLINLHSAFLAVIECYDGNVCNNIAIPIYHVSSGCYHRINFSSAPAISISQLDTSVLSPPGSPSIFRRPKEVITIFRNVFIYSENLFLSKSHNTKIWFILRQVNVDIHGIYPEVLDKNRILVLTRPHTEEFTIFLRYGSIDKVLALHVKIEPSTFLITIPKFISPCFEIIQVNGESLRSVHTRLSMQRETGSFKRQDDEVTYDFKVGDKVVATFTAYRERSFSRDSSYGHSIDIRVSPVFYLYCDR